MWDHNSTKMPVVIAGMPFNVAASIRQSELFFCHSTRQSSPGQNTTSKSCTNNQIVEHEATPVVEQFRIASLLTLTGMERVV